MQNVLGRKDVTKIKEIIHYYFWLYWLKPNWTIHVTELLVLPILLVKFVFGFHGFISLLKVRALSFSVHWLCIEFLYQCIIHKNYYSMQDYSSRTGIYRPDYISNIWICMLWVSLYFSYTVLKYGQTYFKNLWVFKICLNIFQY